MPDTNIPVQSKFNLFFIMAVFSVIILLIGVIAWLFPAYKHIQKENLDLTTTNESLKTQLESDTDRIEYFPNGKIKSETKKKIKKTSSEKSASSEKKDSKFDETIKRGTFTITGYLDIDLKPAGTVTYQVLGPLNIGAGFSNGKPMLGAGLSF